jgi:YVTN family beta-propeller protein
MPAGTMTARRAVLRRLVMPAAAISLAAGLGSVVPVSHAVADAARLAGSAGPAAGPGAPVTAYVANCASGTVTPIATATDTAGPPITVGSGPRVITITPDGKTAYVANWFSGTVTPIATATNTAGPPITVGTYPCAIAITPATVTQAPAFTSGPAATATYGSRFSFTVTTTGDPAPTISRTGRLPSGVRFTDNGDGTATISGTPRKAAAGVYPLTLSARNKYGTATQTFTLTVTRAPAIEKIRSVRTRVGASLRLTVRAAGYPAPALAEAGPLPGGLTFTDNGDGTATIAGTLASADGGGRYPVTIIATNTAGTATRRFKIVVSPRRRQ